MMTLHNVQVMMGLVCAQFEALVLHMHIHISEAAKYIALMLELYKFITGSNLRNLTHSDGTKN